MTDCTFISYAREDQDFALELATNLKQRGVPVWLDQWDIPGGADWDQAIDNALHQCVQFLIILSPAAVASNQVRGELQTALDENKLVIPVVYQTCSIPRPLRVIQHIDFTGRRPQDAPTLDQLMRALHAPQTEPSPKGDTRSNAKRQRLVLLLAGGLSTLVLAAGSLWYLWYSHEPQLLQETPSETPTKKTSAPPATLQGSLQVNVNVDAANVSIDGVDVGVARHAVPLFLSDIKVGQRRVRVEAEGYEPQERVINVLAKEWTQTGFVLMRRVP